MARRHTQGELVWSSEFNAESDDKGLWKGFHAFSCDKDTIGSFLPARGARWELFPFMTVTRHVITGEKGGMVTGRVIYEGANIDASFGGGGPGEAIYSLRVALSEEPLATHPRYDDLTAEDKMEAYELATNPPREKDGKSVKEIDTSGWDPLKVELYEDLQGGIESFRDPKVSWVKKWVDDSLPTNLNDIGEIGTPPGDPPAVASNRNWLFVGLTSDERGGVYDLEEVWELSGRGGWNDRYYSD